MAYIIEIFTWDINNRTGGHCGLPMPVIIKETAAVRKILPKQPQTYAKINLLPW